MKYWNIAENLLKQIYSKQCDLLNIKLVVTDCDGTLTDSGMYWTENGDQFKKFNARDGMGVSLLQKEGINVALITGEDIELVKRRAEKMNINDIYLGIQNKMIIIQELCNKYNIDLQQIAYLGDDINDLECIKSVGFGCCVADGVDLVKKESKYITKLNGGDGAFRELADLIIKNR